MTTRVNFTVYGETLAELRRKALQELALFSDSDFRWNIDMDINEHLMTGHGITIRYEASVSARPKDDLSDWRDAS